MKLAIIMAAALLGGCATVDYSAPQPVSATVYGYKEPDYQRRYRRLPIVVIGCYKCVTVGTKW